MKPPPLRWLAWLPAALLIGCTRQESPDAHEGHDHARHEHHDHDTEHPLADNHDRDRAEDHDHAGHAHDEGGASVSFSEGRGLLLSPATAAALGVRTAAAEMRSLSRASEVTAAVFSAGPPARASALVPAEIADDFAVHPPIGTKLVSIRRDLAPALAQVEVILELSGQPAAGSTVGLTLRGPERPGLAVPRDALLRTATGTFVYVVNGSHLLRTPVRTGAADDRHVEILDGLRAGDTVATAAVDQLRLTELRLTKGGGHSH